MKIYLAGPMGAGKTTVGKIMAQKLKLSHSDLDQILEKKYQQSLSELFECKGEPWFRQQERRVLKQFLTKSRGVFSLGGGSLQNPALVKQIRADGILIYLQVSAREALSRTKGNGSRPLRSNLRALLKKRAYLYRMAEISIRTTGKTPKSVAAELIRTLTEEPSSPRSKR